jgi:hypothetical protein
MDLINEPACQLLTFPVNYLQLYITEKHVTLNIYLIRGTPPAISWQHTTICSFILLYTTNFHGRTTYYHSNSAWRNTFGWFLHDD